NPGVLPHVQLPHLLPHHQPLPPARFPCQFLSRRVPLVHRNHLNPLSLIQRSYITPLLLPNLSLTSSSFLARQISFHRHLSSLMPSPPPKFGCPLAHTPEKQSQTP